jgi:hypothetical protein
VNPIQQNWQQNHVEATDLEIWTIAAFLKKLPTVSEADYMVWTTEVTPVPREGSPRK